MSAANQTHDQGTHTLYRDQGMGLRIPFGKRPAVLIIDMQQGSFTPLTERPCPRTDDARPHVPHGYRVLGQAHGWSSPAVASTTPSLAR